MSINFYLFLHLLGAFILILGYGALLARAVLAPDHKPLRVWGSIISGLGLLMILVGGFGMQAKMGLGWPTWLIIKIVIWLLLGAALSLINKKPALNKLLWAAVIVLAGLAAWLGVFGILTPSLQ
ncbi:MAG: hypothetical protein ACQKBT_12515 [Puniceicoccales bacterium]